MSTENKEYTRKNISDDTIELTVSIKRETFEKSYDALLEREAKQAEMKGFRKGEVPKEVVEEKMGDAIRLQAFEQIAPLYVNSAVMKEEIQIITPPSYKELPKLKGKEALEVTVVLTVMPEFKLGNMKKIKIKKEKLEVTDKEMEEVLERLKNNPQMKTDKMDDKWAEETAKKLLMEGVKTMDALKKELEKVLMEQKENISRQTQESDALKQAIELSKIKIPEAAMHYEAHEREHQFVHQLEAQKMSFEDWAKNNGTTVEEVRDRWHKDALEALEADVFLKLYAEANNIEITQEELDTAVNKIKASKQVQDESVYENEEWLAYMKQIEMKKKGYEHFRTSVFGEEKKAEQSKKETKK
jgi:FKBP-type peptidyl-prolyl cis-trans isomerase (trigger factor)